MLVTITIRAFVLIFLHTFFKYKKHYFSILYIFNINQMLIIDFNRRDIIANYLINRVYYLCNVKSNKIFLFFILPELISLKKIIKIHV
jgi:hypothetical protein